SEERLRLLVESVNDYAIFMLDPQGRVTTWNRGAQAINGYRGEEILGRHFSIFYLAEDVQARRPEFELARALPQGPCEGGGGRGRGRCEEEGWGVGKKGERFGDSGMLAAVHDATGQHRGFAKVTRDLSERRRVEQEARAAEAREVEARARALEAQKAVQLRDEFISVAAHELRTPLTALQLKLQGLERALGESEHRSDPRVLRRVEGASRQVHRLTRLVEELLDVSRIVGGRLVLSLEEVDLGALTAAVVDDLLEPARRAGSELRLRRTAIVGRWD